MSVILIILVLLLPISLYAYFKSWYLKEKNRHGNVIVQRSLNEIIKRHRFTISEMNKFINRVIAFDRNTGRLILVVYKDAIIWQKCIGFEEIRSCEIISTFHPENGHIQKVTLELSLCNNHKNISFAFFDEKIEDVRDLGRRMKQARYWDKKIQYYLFSPASRYLDPSN